MEGSSGESEVSSPSSFAQEDVVEPPKKRQKTKIEEESTKRSFECTYDGCGKSYSRQYELERHVRHRHIGIRSHICKLCGKGFFESEVLRKHEICVHQQPFPCDFEGCTLTFSRESLLIAHKAKTHLQSLPYSCSFQGCSASFDYMSRLTKHMESHNKKDPSKQVCIMAGCFLEFSKKSELKAHLSKFHPESFSKPKCDICGNEFFDQSTLRRHMKIHQPNREMYNCQLCGKTFSTKPNLNGHIQRVHEGKVTKYKCSIEGCDREFWHKQKLRQHEESHNSDQNISQENMSINDYKKFFESAFGFTINAEA